MVKRLKSLCFRQNKTVLVFLQKNDKKLTGFAKPSWFSQVSNPWAWCCVIVCAREPVRR